MDNRLRVTSYQNTSTADAGNTNYGYSLTYYPNSNVKTDAETGYDSGVGAKSWSWTFNYDTLNRLANATSTGAIQFGCSETYDPFGNRTNQVPYGGTGYSCTSPSTPVTPGTNRLSGYSYDNAGDVLYDGFNTLTYDAEGHISTSTSSGGGTTSYTYDAEGQRISKTLGGAETDFVRDLDGTLLDTWVSGSYTNPSQAQELWINGRHYGSVYVYLNNGAPAQLQGTGLTNWLGTETMKSYSTGATGGATGIPTYLFASQPYGDARTDVVGSGFYDDIFFTGKERDVESGNDYFKYRYYASSMGRWLSPDPSGLSHADLENPQSLNLYNYVGNRPLTLTDLDGLCWKGFQWACDLANDIRNLAIEAKNKIGYGEWTTNTQQAIIHKLDRDEAKARTNSYRKETQSAPDPDDDRPQLTAMVKGTAQLTGWIPDACSGGTFTYAGKEVSSGGAHAFQGVIVEHDSESGTSSGLLTEVGGGEETVGGVGVIQPISGGGANEPIAFGGVGGDVGAAEASGGAFLSPGSIGGYGEVGAGGRVVGGGAYVNVSTMANCARKR
jgi:RHS repeat-associated protein